MTDIRATVHSERIKLTANFLNGTAIALTAIGGHRADRFLPFECDATRRSAGRRADGAGLFCQQPRPTFAGESRYREAARMTGQELLLIFDLPAMFLVTGFAAYLVSRRETDRFDRSRVRPGE